MINLHSHSDVSNIRVIDSLAKVEGLIQTAADLRLGGVALTEHESISSHIKGIQITRRLKEEGKIPQDFKLVLGNEIYLVDSLEEVRDNYQSGVTKFPHFLILAKNSSGHEAIRKMSSMAWENSFYTGMMERVPTIKKELVDIVKEYPNTLIASSACLGSESSIHILNNEYEKAKDFLMWCSSVFGKENFYLEIQPSKSEEQRKVNHKLVEFSEELGLELIITTDAHYLRPEDAEIHAAFLNSKSAEREVASFYESCYLHTENEIYDKLDYLDKSIVKTALENTVKIGNQIEEYNLEKATIIPKIQLPSFDVMHLFEDGYKEYSYIGKMANSDNEQDRYLIHLVEKGFIELMYTPDITRERFHQILSRINLELGELWEISIKMKQAMSSYYNTVQEIISIMWGDDCGENSRTEGSLVGSGRGSASGYLINYLLGITQICPLDYGVEMPHWRHLEKMRGDVSALDIDVDCAPHMRPVIFNRMKEKFGKNRVLQVATFGTEGSKSAIQTACRGLGYDLDIGQHISSLIPFERGANYSISECLYGSEDGERKAVKEFIREIEKYPKLKETALKIEGVINKRSIHAGGVIVTNEDYIKSNAMMKAPNGTPITQLNLDDTQACGSIKYDLLGVSNISKLQESINIMLDEGMIEWEGTLRKTFNKVLRPERLDLNDPEIYELLGKAEIPDLFQFDTKLANQALTTTKPTNLIEMAAVNSLMRLMGNSDESPIDTFAKFKNDITLWYNEMKSYNLTEEEIEVMEKHLLPISGIADTQESIMMLAMDEKVANFDIIEANVLRKAVAKKKEDIFEKARKNFFAKGRENGTSENLLKYVWDVQISRQKSYSFSILHTIAYSIIGIQNIVIVAKYSPLIWHTACLTINSGSLEVEEGAKGKTTQYGKIASAIGNLKSYGVNIELPLINNAKFGFTPDLEGDRIIFGLKGINSIGDDIAHAIISNRPYNSFEDFHERMYLAKTIQKSHMLQLIKGGAFNEFGSPSDIMKQFIVKEVDVKDKLNGQNLPRIITLGLLDTPELKHYQDYFNFRKHVMKSVHQVIEKPKDKIYVLDSYSQVFFENNFSSDSVVGEHNNKILVSDKLLKKEYDNKMLPLTELYTDSEFIRRFNQMQFMEIWNSLASGTKEDWEMESVSFYSDKHRLSNVDYTRYGISDFNSLPETPIVKEEFEWRGRTMRNYELFTIIGTVLDKNTNNHSITILTPEGVVTAKTYSGSFSHYNKQISRLNGGKKEVLEKSWFTRGNLLMLTGYRRGDQFVLKAPKGQHTINLITEVREDGSLGLQSERTRA